MSAYKPNKGAGPVSLPSSLGQRPRRPDSGPQEYITKDSGERQQWASGAQRDTQTGKPRFDLIPADALRRLAMLYARGALKYDDFNWTKGIDYQRCLASLMRHLNQFQLGEEDEDHLAAVVWNAMAIMHYQCMQRDGELNTLYDYTARGCCGVRTAKTVTQDAVSAQEAAEAPRGRNIPDRPVAYVSGPYTADTPEGIDANIAAAREIACRLWEMGYTVICPHQNTANFERDCQIGYRDYIDGDLELVRRVDLLVMRPGWEASSGACEECGEATRVRVPVFEWPTVPPVAAFRVEMALRGTQGTVQ